MAGHGRDLPAVSLFGLLFRIPDDFGGMTTAALHRATSLSQLYDRRFDLLTLTPQLDLQAKRAELRSNGILGERVRLRNLWQELRHADDHDLAGITGTARTPVAGDEQLPVSRHSPDAERWAEDGTVLQVNRFRDDGSLLLTDRRDVRTFGRQGGRRLTLFGRNGLAVAQWNSSTALYRAWLDLVTAAEPAVLISDSNFAGGLLHTYRREHVTVVQVLHSPHLADPSGSLDGRIASGKWRILTNLDKYDVVTVPTEQQRADMFATSMAVDNLVTVSNSYTGGIGGDDERRARNRGIVVARLTRVKRLDHAVRAVVRTRIVGVTLDIYGNGRTEQGLRKLIADLGVSGRVRLRGYDPRAREQFAEASFTVLTSKFEGQAVTLLESMAAGCIPIAYDVRYGPASIITHGVDGFLVPAGDIRALTAAIEYVITLDARTLDEMRRAARRRAAQYRPEVIGAQWAKLLDDAVKAKLPVVEPTGSATLHSAELVGSVLRLTVAVTVHPPGRELDWACLSWLRRGSTFYGRVRATITDCREGWFLEADIPLRRMADIATDTLDLSVDIRSEGEATRLGISTGGVPLPGPTETVELHSSAHGQLSIRGRTRSQWCAHRLERFYRRVTRTSA